MPLCSAKWRVEHHLALSFLIILIWVNKSFLSGSPGLNKLVYYCSLNKNWEISLTLHFEKWKWERWSWCVFDDQGQRKKWLRNLIKPDFPLWKGTWVWRESERNVQVKQEPRAVGPPTTPWGPSLLPGAAACPPGAPLPSRTLCLGFKSFISIIVCTPWSLEAENNCKLEEEEKLISLKKMSKTKNSYCYPAINSVYCWQLSLMESRVFQYCPFWNCLKFL